MALTPIDTNTQSLAVTLRKLNWRYEKPVDPKRQGCRVFDDQGNDLGILEAHECWRKLRDRGLISPRKTAA